MASASLKHNTGTPYVSATFWIKPASSMMPLRHLAVLRIYKNYFFAFPNLSVLEISVQKPLIPPSGGTKALWPVN